jgi:hypothetical protein
VRDLRNRLDEQLEDHRPRRGDEQGQEDELGVGPEIHTASLRGGYGPTSGRSLHDVRQHDRENVQDRDREGDRRDQRGGVDERLCVRIQVHPIPLPEPCHPEGVRRNPSIEASLH